MKLNLRNDPSTLFQLAKCSLCKQILQIVNSKKYKNSKYIKILHNYFEYKLPQNIIDTILNECVTQLDEKNILMEENQFRILELLVNSQTQIVKINSLSEIRLLNVFKLIQKRGYNIHHLEINKFWLLNDIVTDFQKFLSLFSKFSKLQTLSINNIIINRNEIGCFLPISQNIHYNNFLCNNSTGDVQFLNNICEINLGGYNFWSMFSPYDVSQIIESLPHLKKIKQYIFTARAIEILALRSKRKLLLTDLSDFSTNENTIKAVIELCPSITMIELISPRNNVISHLRKLTKLNHVYLIDFNSDEFEEIVTERGVNYTTLNLKKGKGKLNLTIILKSCPNISIFECLYCFGLYIDNNIKFHCPNMFKFKIFLTPSPSTNRKEFQNIFLGFPDVQILTVIGWQDITDLEMKGLIQKNIWKHLKVIKLKYTINLTEKTFYLLFENCQLLKRIEGIGSWGIHCEEIKTLQNKFQHIGFVNLKY